MIAAEARVLIDDREETSGRMQFCPILPLHPISLYSRIGTHVSHHFPHYYRPIVLSHNLSPPRRGLTSSRLDSRQLESSKMPGPKEQRKAYWTGVYIRSVSGPHKSPDELERAKMEHDLASGEYSYRTSGRLFGSPVFYCDTVIGALDEQKPHIQSLQAQTEFTLS